MPAGQALAATLQLAERSSAIVEILAELKPGRELYANVDSTPAS